MDTLNTITKIIAEQTGLMLSEVEPESRLLEDLHCDSIDLIELVMMIEDEFGIEIHDHQMEGVATVADAVALVDRIVQG